ncbi:enoyl-CoA hydratase-related protein [Streptomyces roseoverticillatus]|uniref:enoyl-CoA hydratase-related protein n=1 Tax=Streptomyces roseoverticillatus TaxID=66429 RepID=UPI003F55CDA6
MIAVSEAFVLGESLSLTHQALLDVASTASGQCWALTTNCPVPGPVPGSPADRSYVPGFAAPLIAKDLGLAANAARAGGVDAELGLRAARMYAEFAEGDGTGQDFSGIVLTGFEKAFAAGADIKEMRPQSYTRAVGKAKAMELCLTGRTMDAEEAERAGLVSRIVPAGELLSETLAVGETVAGMSAPVAMMAEEAVNRAFETTLTEGIRFERRLLHAVFATADQKEGMAAFVEKRPPEFTNR